MLAGGSVTSVFGSSFSYSLSGRVATIFLPQLLDSIIGHKLNCIPPVRSSHAVISLLVRHALAELEIAKLAVSRGVDLRRGQSQTQTRHFHAFNGRHQRPQPHRDCPKQTRKSQKERWDDGGVKNGNIRTTGGAPQTATSDATTLDRTRIVDRKEDLCERTRLVRGAPTDLRPDT